MTSDINGNNNYTSKIVYETNPIICDTQKEKANADVNVMQDKNRDNTQISFAFEQCNKELPSQFTNEMTVLSLKHEDNTYIDEGYITQFSTNHNLQNLSLMITNEKKSQKDLNMNLSNVSAQSWKNIKIPERWKFKNDISSHNGDLKTINTINISSDQNCDNNKESQDSDSINKLNDIFQGNDNEKLVDKCRYVDTENGTSKSEERKRRAENEISNQENLSKNAGSDFLFRNCFVFHKIGMFDINRI